MTADSEDRWTIRGVPLDVRQRSSAAAKARGISVGAWLVEVVEATLAGQSAGTAPISITSPLEARIAALEARIDVMEADRTQKPASAPLVAVAPATVADTPMTPETLPDPRQKRQTRKPWIEADNDVLRRIAAEGGTQADAAHELGRPSSVVNGKWKALGLPVMPRKGRTVTRRHRLPE